MAVNRLTYAAANKRRTPNVPRRQWYSYMPKFALSLIQRKCQYRNWLSRFAFLKHTRVILVHFESSMCPFIFDQGNGVRYCEN